MISKLLLTVFVLFVIQYNECQAGKFGAYGGGFGGPGGFGGGFGGPGGYGGAGGMASINQLRFKLIISQQQVNLTRNNANATVSDNIIAVAQTSIDGELTTAKNKASAVVGAPNCVNQHSLAVSQINSELVKTKCDQSLQFLAIDNQILLFSGMHSEMSQVYRMCPFWPPTLQETCIQNFVLDFGTKLDSTVTSINDAINTAISDSATCVAGETQAAHDAITKANNDLDKCVASPV